VDKKGSSRSFLRLPVLSLTLKLGCAATAAVAGATKRVGPKKIEKREGNRKGFVFFKRDQSN
jgi:hypothetical protein